MESLPYEVHIDSTPEPNGYLRVVFTTLPFKVLAKIAPAELMAYKSDPTPYALSHRIRYVPGKTFVFFFDMRTQEMNYALEGILERIKMSGGPEVEAIFSGGRLEVLCSLLEKHITSIYPKYSPPPDVGTIRRVLGRNYDLDMVVSKPKTAVPAIPDAGRTTDTLFSTIIWLNDKCNWTFDQIADWLDTLDGVEYRTEEEIEEIKSSRAKSLQEKIIQDKLQKFKPKKYYI